MGEMPNVIATSVEWTPERAEAFRVATTELRQQMRHADVQPAFFNEGILLFGAYLVLKGFGHCYPSDTALRRMDSWSDRLDW